MCQNTLRKHLDKKCKEVLDGIKAEMEKVDFICTTADLWSGAKRGFCGITASWLLDDLSRKSVTIACPRMKGTHSHDKIAMVLESTGLKFAIQDKIVGCVTDSGKYFTIDYLSYKSLYILN